MGFPYLLFGLTVFVMEGTARGDPTRIYALPALFLGWSLADSSWWLGVVFSTMYLHFPELKNRSSAASFLYCSSQDSLLGLAGHALLDRSILSALQFHPDGTFLSIASNWRSGGHRDSRPLCLVLYWKKLTAPHRWKYTDFCLPSSMGRPVRCLLLCRGRCSSAHRIQEQCGFSKTASFFEAF